MANIHLQLVSGLLERGASRPVPPCTTRTPFLDAWAESSPKSIDEPQGLYPSDSSGKTATIAATERTEHLASHPRGGQVSPQSESAEDLEHESEKQPDLCQVPPPLASGSRESPNSTPTTHNPPQEASGPAEGEKLSEVTGSAPGQSDPVPSRDSEGPLPSPECPLHEPSEASTEEERNRPIAFGLVIREAPRQTGSMNPPVPAPSAPLQGKAAEASSLPGREPSGQAKPLGVSISPKDRPLQRTFQLEGRDASAPEISGDPPREGIPSEVSNTHSSPEGSQSRQPRIVRKTKVRQGAPVADWSDSARIQGARVGVGSGSSVNSPGVDRIFPFSTLLASAGSEVSAGSPVSILSTEVARFQATASASGEGSFFLANLSSGGTQPIMEVTSPGPAAGGPLGVTSPDNLLPSWLGESLDVADHQRFIHRVAQAFTSGLRRDGILRLKLHPPELGSLRLELRFKEGKLHARLEADRPEVCNLLTDHLHQLRQRLEANNLSVEKFEVTLNQEGASSRNQAFFGQPGFTGPGGVRSDPAESDTQPSSPAKPGNAIPGVIEAARVDVRI